MKLIETVVLSASLAFTITSAHAGATFDAVKGKGYVQCGLSTGTPGFSVADSKGEWYGFDVDMCKAVAAAMFGDASKFRGTPLSPQQRFTALQSGEIDLLTRTVTATMGRDTTLGLMSTGINHYDSQGILVNKSLGIKNAAELDGAAVCVQTGSTTELNLADWSRSQNLNLKTVVVADVQEGVRAFVGGRCDAFTSDKSQLASIRTTLDKPAEYEILSDDLSKEPNGPMVRQGDQQWFNVVRWTLNAMLEAEEYGITSQNVDEMLASSNPNVQRILGVTGDLGQSAGLDNKWAYNVIKHVGNYGESFARTLGKDTPMNLERGLDAQWKDGGLMYGWPLR
ncbi:amino acid ABC transporter substrate-binding protein [Alcaligenaceae bacterium]|nr:amino acid ABC transporter substrate-binding protein [Alcaligenaceae bacterium]